MIYSTKQKEKILEIIKNYNKEFTVKDIYEKLNGNVGLTTIYRFIEKLKKEGNIIANIKDDNQTTYEYIITCEKENHFYLKCLKCGRLEHIDCDCINELNNHIKKEHNFKIDKNKIVINGICNKCL